MQLRIYGLNRKDRQLRTSIQRRLWFVLGRFASRIGYVTVDLSERENSGRGKTKQCRIIVNVLRSGRLRAEETGPDLEGVIERANYRVGHQVRREIEQQREQLNESASPLGPSM